MADWIRAADGRIMWTPAAVATCWCGKPAQYVNPASDATPATNVCAAHVADGYDLIRPMGAKVVC